MGAALEDFLKECETRYPDVFNFIWLDQNGGLGKALKRGVEHAKYDIIARIDSDDICLTNSFDL